ncbi:hypothetical protein [Ferruginibacter sp. HRS2-29]|uniref:hypothetical protein n=1 Tax=Ferruginibacter sp. HRS2-29 TaxID=2487334 RepID=UPI0020CC8A47|nr:hypothetical protein [Ferruginibacter sp. HRS2-29]MCP9752645.1 hypothetical protein [Ferruginibacter sp. HRS2-29]
MPEVFGNFLIKFINGFYSGEYFNNYQATVNPEGILALTNFEDFVGTFETTWTESDIPHTSLLTVNRVGDIYTLSWTNVRRSGVNIDVEFDGRGFIRDGILNCYYSMRQI